MEAAEIISGNAKLQALARELNTRAGEKLFMVMSREEIENWLKQRLGGARSLKEIKNLRAIALPVLDSELVDLVLGENPDEIDILGNAVKVEYREGATPRVKIDFYGEEARSWLELPDSGIRLPGGREVSMYSAVEGYGYYIDVMSSEFKQRVCECLNEGVLNSWERPQLPAPTDSIPPIVEVEYGRCVVTGALLVAYGVVHHDSWNGLWKSLWSRSRAEAEQVHAQSCADLVSVKERVARNELKKRVDELYSTHIHDDGLPQEIRTRLYDLFSGRSHEPMPLVEMQAFIAEFEATVIETAARKADEERIQRESAQRRAAVNSALAEIDQYPEAHIWVPQDGDVAYVLAGKTTKMGSYFVHPSAGDTICVGPHCFGDYKYKAWVPFTFGVRSRGQGFSGSGNLQSEVKLFVPKDFLPAGVYGVSSDDVGQFFFPVIYHSAEGMEVVPEVNAVRKIRVSKEATKPKLQQASVGNAEQLVDLTKVDLGGLFGGNARRR